MNKILTQLTDLCNKTAQQAVAQRLSLAENLKSDFFFGDRSHDMNQITYNMQLSAELGRFSKQLEDLSDEDAMFVLKNQIKVYTDTLVSAHSSTNLNGDGWQVSHFISTAVTAQMIRSLRWVEAQIEGPALI